MKTIFFTFILSTIFAEASSFALTCKEIEKYDDEDGNITYFTDLTFHKEPSDIYEKQMRKSVADFVGYCGEPGIINEDECYRDTLPLKKVSELGEDVQFYTRKGKNKVVYTAVNVGFGGGNSAVYYYEQGTLNMEKFMIVDGSDCRKLESELRKDEVKKQKEKTYDYSCECIDTGLECDGMEKMELELDAYNEVLKLMITDDDGDHGFGLKGTLDSDYKPRTNKEYVRFNLTGSYNDAFPTMLVEKKMMKGSKAGELKLHEKAANGSITSWAYSCKK